MKAERRGKAILPVLFWLAVWQAVSLLVRNSVVIVGPWETARALAAMLPTAGFWRAVGNSTGRIVLGFLTGAAAGMALAFLAYRFRAVEFLFSPFIGFLKAVPVASFVILLLIWAGSRRLAFYITLTVVLPVLYLNTLQGLRSTDPKLLEMAELFRMGALARLKGVYLPQLRSFWLAALELGCGMAWKAGIAAEVIGQPLGTLGNELYRAKVYLETDRVLAVTAVAVFLSWALGKLLLRLLRGREGDGA